MTVTPTSTSAAMKCSWADIVKGPTVASAPEPETEDVELQPGTRGDRRCLCQGEILVMLGHYGWIMTFGDIDHPEVGKTAGRVYVHERDVEEGLSLAKGDVVSFYLYIDEQGLGAECCQLKRPAFNGLAADADEFVPAVQAVEPSWNVCAAEFVPTVPAAVPNGFNAYAAEFVPSEVSAIDYAAKHFVPAAQYSNYVAPNPNVFSFNPAFFSDDDSDDESSIGSDDEVSGNDADKEYNESDKESSLASPRRHAQEDSDSDLDIAVLCAPLKSPRASSGEDSTSAGGSDDSEVEDMTIFVKRAALLNYPPGLRPPPGLTLPVLVA